MIKLPYLAKPHLGRVARLDWNSDGKPDLVDRPPTREHQFVAKQKRKPLAHCVRLRLIMLCPAAMPGWVTASAAMRRPLGHGGDGYQASNQRELIVEIGRCGTVDELTVHWPAGHVQSLKHRFGIRPISEDSSAAQ
ncbi:MAG: ASPIC/UnbV domain-containing protein [Pirellulales bacterium]